MSDSAKVRQRAIGRVAVFMAVACFPSCKQHSPATEPPWSDSSPHKTRLVTVSGLPLQVFDWGGSGEHLMLIHGAGVTPHHFDGIAPLLTSRFHVVSFARRGHGESGTPQEGFDVDVLADDLGQVMDSLGIDKAVLLAHSFGGNEITRFGALHPDRVRGLVYLDAHFERFDSPWLAADDDRPQVQCPGPSTKTIDDYRECAKEYLVPGMQWPEEMEALIRDMAVEGSSDPLEFKMDAQPAVGSSMRAINIEYHREYDRINVPVLVLMAGAYFPQTQADSALNESLREWNERVFAPAQEWTVNRFREAIPGVRVVRLAGTSHFGVVSQARDRIVQEVLGFEDSLPSRTP